MLITGSFQIFVGKKKLTLEQKIHYESLRVRFRLINPNPKRLASRGGKKGAGWNLDASSDFALGWSGEGKGN